MRFGVCIISLTSMLSVASSLQADIKAYHGAFCVPQGIDWDNDGNDEVIIDGSGVYNKELSNGGIAMMFICPLVRDRVSSATSLDHVTVEIYNSNNGGNPFWCTLRSQTEDSSGATLDFHTQSTTTLQNTQITNFNVDMTTGTEGSFSLSCALGNEDRLYQVMVEEEGGVD